MDLFVNTELAEYCKRLIALKGQEDRTFRLALDNTRIKKIIRQLNTVKQLRTDHIDSTGTELYSNKHDSGVYSGVTEILSKGRKKAGTPYTLFDTGDFFNSWVVDVQNGFITINANPIKKGDSFGGTNLFEEYGINILGLTDENLGILISEALEKYITWYRQNALPR